MAAQDIATVIESKFDAVTYKFDRLDSKIDSKIGSMLWMLSAALALGVILIAVLAAILLLELAVPNTPTPAHAPVIYRLPATDAAPATETQQSTPVRNGRLLAAVPERL